MSEATAKMPRELLDRVAQLFGQERADLMAKIVSAEADAKGLAAVVEDLLADKTPWAEKAVAARDALLQHRERVSGGN